MKRLYVIVSFLLFLLSTQPVNAITTFKVLKVIDGDTVVVNVRGNQEVVRLLGIDTPESVDPRKPVQCFAVEAANKMKAFVNGKNVILVDDGTQGNRDRYRRLLRYIYLPDSVRTFVNGEMVKQGYAFSYRQYPTKMLSKFNNLEKYARENSLGLWGSCPVNAPSVKTYETPKNSSSQSNTGSGSFSCGGKTLCGQMTSCEEAYFYLNSCSLTRLDGDKDGVPCEKLCR